MENDATVKFRELLANDDLLLCPLVGDPLSARLAQRSGVPIALLGGFAVSAHRYALPDAGLITFTDVLDQIRNTCDAVPGFPIIADADTGYGNAMNVRRTVTEFAKAGAAALLIEDQLWPKKCGHYGGPREVIPRAEARMKMRAARRTSWSSAAPMRVPVTDSTKRWRAAATSKRKAPTWSSSRRLKASRRCAVSRVRSNARGPA
jgi:2-methylisocitrate lyase-like PEP mutase family enzyme